MGFLHRVRKFDSLGRRSVLIAGKQLHEIPVRVSDERDPQSGLGCVAERPNRAAPTSTLACASARRGPHTRTVWESQEPLMCSCDLGGGAPRSRQLPRPDCVSEVGHALCRFRADRLQGHAARVHAFEQADSGAEQHG